MTGGEEALDLRPASACMYVSISLLIAHQCVPLCDLRDIFELRDINFTFGRTSVCDLYDL